MEDWREGRVGNGRRWYVVEEERGGVYEGGWRCESGWEKDGEKNGGINRAGSDMI